MAKPTDPKKHAFMFTDDIKFLQKAVVFHPENNKFLALKRTADSFSRPNDWDLAGGNVLYGELHDESLRNEIKEETNLEVGDLTPAQIITKYDEDGEPYQVYRYDLRGQTKTVLGRKETEHDGAHIIRVSPNSLALASERSETVKGSGSVSASS